MAARRTILAALFISIALTGIGGINGQSGTQDWLRKATRAAKQGVGWVQRKGVVAGKILGVGIVGGRWSGFPGGQSTYLRYNTSLLANLTDFSQTRVGSVALSLFLNTNTSDYELSYRVRVRLPPGDTATTAVVLAGSTPTINLTATTPFVTRGNISAVGGTLKSLSTVKTADGQTYLDVVKAMIASPGGYIAQVASARMSAGVAGGTFVTKALPGMAVTTGRASGGGNLRGAIRGRGH